MSTSIIKILLIGEFSIFRNALRMLLETDKRLKVIGEADNVEDARTIESVESPDLTIADLPELQAREVLPSLCALNTPVLVLMGKRDIEIYKQCLQFGLSGLVLKEERAEVLFKSIYKINEGELWFDRSMMGETIRHLIGESQTLRENNRQNIVVGLTDREKEVIKHLCLGLKTKDIANALYITENTVRHHLTSVFNKLEIKGRLELVIYAFKNGLAAMPNGIGSRNGINSSREISRALSV